MTHEQTMNHVHPPFTRMFEVHALKAAAQGARLGFLASRSGYSCGAELHALFMRRIFAAF